MPKDQRRTYACSFCGKDQSQVQRLVAGPGGVYICDSCVMRIAGESEEERGANAERCSFCHKWQSQTRFIRRSSRQAAICNECIELCQEIFAKEQATIRPKANPLQREDGTHLPPEKPS